MDANWGKQKCLPPSKPTLSDRRFSDWQYLKALFEDEEQYLTGLINWKKIILWVQSEIEFTDLTSTSAPGQVTPSEDNDEAIDAVLL